MNDNGKGKGVLRAILPLLVILLVLIFVYFLWRYYHPNRPIDLHQTHVSQLHRRGMGSHRLPAIRS